MGSVHELPVDGPTPHLALNKQGRPLKTLANAIDLLTEHEAWHGVVAYDAFRECVVKIKPPPTRSVDECDAVTTGEWTDGDSVRTAAWLSAQAWAGHRMNLDPAFIERALLAVAERNTIHPVRDWLRSLEWDGLQRLPRLFPDYFRAHDTLFAQEAGKRWMIAACARVFQPGCQSKYMPVLESVQDMGKSTGIAALAGCGSDGASWYSDTGLRIGDKDSYQCLRAKLIYEWAELASFKSARDVETLKNFISSQTDNYRPSYGRRSRDFPRQCVFIGTTNDERWLTDPTGGSRFWPIRCYPLYVDRARIAADRTQLWAEAVVRFDAGEHWWFDTPELADAARDEQECRREPDPWVEFIARWLDNPTIPTGSSERTRLYPREHGVTGADVLLGAIAIRPENASKNFATRLGYAMADLGWSRHRVTRGSKRVWAYFAEGVIPARATDAWHEWDTRSHRPTQENPDD